MASITPSQEVLIHCVWFSANSSRSISARSRIVVLLSASNWTMHVLLKRIEGIPWIECRLQCCRNKWTQETFDVDHIDLVYARAVVFAVAVQHARPASWLGAAVFLKHWPRTSLKLSDSRASYQGKLLLVSHWLEVKSQLQCYRLCQQPAPIGFHRIIDWEYCTKLLRVSSLSVKTLNELSRKELLDTEFGIGIGGQQEVRWPSSRTIREG